MSLNSLFAYHHNLNWWSFFDVRVNIPKDMEHQGRVICIPDHVLAGGTLQ